MENHKKPIAEEIKDHYKSYDESQRLTNGFGALEQTRTQELIQRYLSAPPATVLDIGGANGVYSFWLSNLGYQVHLIDIVDNHIAQAKKIASEQSISLESMVIGDARKLDFPDNFADVIIMHGPLYHLVEQNDRLTALRESLRILKPGGLLLGFAITRYAGLIYGLTQGHIFGNDYMNMITEEVETGVRNNSPKWANTFSSAYFHRPEDLQSEIEEAGYQHLTTLGVIGPAWLVPNLNESWNNEKEREKILAISRLVENESVLGPRLMVVGRKENSL
jgi:ubiquinone/menaquinone biosynthesis C-methylase UbiE